MLILRKAVTLQLHMTIFGLVMEVNAEQGDIKLNFLHPKGPAVSFHFPKNDDLCWIPRAHIICSIDTPNTCYNTWTISSHFCNYQKNYWGLERIFDEGMSIN